MRAVIQQTGLVKFPDLILVNDLSEMPAIEGKMAAIQRLDPNDLTALRGPWGERLRTACGRRTPPALLPRNQREPVPTCPDPLLHPDSTPTP